MTRSLEGLRLVVSGFELEQQEHRGIAVFTKGLLRALKGAGAEIWLLTEVEPSVHDIAKARLPKEDQESNTASRILDRLKSGEEMEVEQNRHFQNFKRKNFLKEIIELFQTLKQRKKNHKLHFSKEKSEETRARS